MEAYLANALNNYLITFLYEKYEKEENNITAHIKWDIINKLRNELSEFLDQYGSSAERIHLDDFLETVKSILDNKRGGG